MYSIVLFFINSFIFLSIVAHTRADCSVSDSRILRMWELMAVVDTTTPVSSKRMVAMSWAGRSMLAFMRARSLILIFGPDINMHLI